MDDIKRLKRENDRMKKEVEGYKSKIKVQKRLIDAWAKSYLNASRNNWHLAYAVKEALEMIERKGGWVERSAVENVVYERVVGTMKKALIKWDGQSVKHAIKILNRYYFDQIGSETTGRGDPVATNGKEVTVMKIEKCCGGKKKGCRGGKGK